MMKIESALKKTILLLPAMVTLFALPEASARAGTNSGGGGVGYSCHYSDGSHRVYMADTYSMVTSGQIAKLNRYQPVDLTQAAAAYLDTVKPEKKYDSPVHVGEKVTLGWMINYRHQQLKFTPNFSGKLNLPTLTDDHISENTIPPGCKKVQLAVQEIESMTVAQSPLIYKLTWPERGFLELHETLISLRGVPGADTTPIRADVAFVANELEASNSALRQRIVNALPNGWADLCFNQRAQIDLMLSHIEDPGVLAGDAAIEKMCLATFKVGDEMFGIGAAASGGGYGHSHENEIKTCYVQIYNDVQAKMDAMYAYRRRCRAFIEKGRCNGTNSTEKYEMTAQVMGLGAWGLCPVTRAD